MPNELVCAKFQDSKDADMVMQFMAKSEADMSYIYESHLST